LHHDSFFIAIFAAVANTGIRSLICNMSILHPLSHNLPLQEALFVFALESEAAEEFTDCNTLITGIGKVSAAYTLTKYIANLQSSSILGQQGVIDSAKAILFAVQNSFNGIWM
jgi:hypothetical protein